MKKRFVFITAQRKELRGGNMKKRRLMLCSIISLIMVFVMAVPMTVSADTNVAKVGDTEYATLEAAVGAAGDGDTVTLLTAASINNDLTVGKNITLALAGNTLTASANINVTGQLTINDTTGGVIDFKGNKCFVVDGTSAKATLESGKVLCNDKQGYAFYAKNGGTAVINGGTVESLYSPLSGNNTTGNMNFEVNGGTITAKYGPAIYMPGQGKLKITAGTINGGISLRMGHVDISGGTINAVTSDIDSPSKYYAYSGNAWFPDALYVFGGTYKSTAGNELVLNITGGTFNCTNGQGSGIAIYDLGKINQKMETSISGRAVITTNAANRDAYQVLSLSDIGVEPNNGYGNAANTGKVASSISGGTFSSSPAKYVAEGKVAIKFVRANKDGNYYVGTEKEIQAIVDNAKAGDTIDVIHGKAHLTLTKSGVTIGNKGAEEVVVNGQELAKGTITVIKEVDPTKPSQDQTQKPSDTAKADKSAKTGDDFNLFAVGGVALAAIIAMAAVAITGRRHRQR